MAHHHFVFSIIVFLELTALKLTHKRKQTNKILFEIIIFCLKAKVQKDYVLQDFLCN